MSKNSVAPPGPGAPAGSIEFRLTMPAAYPKQNALAKTLREIGRLERTLFTLDWISDPALRRRTNAGPKGNMHVKVGTASE